MILLQLSLDLVCKYSNANKQTVEIRPQYKHLDNLNVSVYSRQRNQPLLSGYYL